MTILTIKRQVEAKGLLILVLKTIEILKNKFRTHHIVDILHGKKTYEVLSYEHDKLEVFGSGCKEKETTWNIIIHQAIASGFLEKEIESCGLLKLTHKGRKYLNNPTSFKITKNKNFKEEENKDVNDTFPQEEIACVIDTVLFSMMKDLRKKLSKKNNISPYVIFQDSSLEIMASTYPITMEELQNISGIEIDKALCYGQEFIKLIKQYMVENEIERSEDIHTHTMINKSKMKVFIIQKIDRKVDLYEIASEKELEFDELLSEIESIVCAGTKINIDYFIYKTVEKEHIEDIYQYFKESRTDRLKDAMDKLGNDYTKEEIQLIRIKFLSEFN